MIYIVSGSNPFPFYGVGVPLILPLLKSGFYMSSPNNPFLPKLLLPQEEVVLIHSRERLKEDTGILSVDYEKMALSADLLNAHAHLTYYRVRIIRDRLHVLKYLEDGWYDGTGTRLDPDFLDAVAPLCVSIVQETDMILPFIYPSIDPVGGIHIECRCPDFDVEIEIRSNLEMEVDVYAKDDSFEHFYTYHMEDPGLKDTLLFILEHGKANDGSSQVNPG